MMIDADVVACSSATVYRVLSMAGLLKRNSKSSKKGTGMKHVRTSLYYPQSYGKIERYHRTIKSRCIRPLCPLTLDDARRIIGKFVDDYNLVRLHSAIGYVTPHAMLDGKQQAIFDERDRKIEQARQRRAEARQAKRSSESLTSTESTSYTLTVETEDRGLGKRIGRCP